MPLAKSWVEELVAQYYILKGYIVVADVPIGSGERGGRVDVDILALDPRRKEVHMVEVKAICTGTAEEIAKSISGTLSRAEEYFKREYGLDYKYVKRAVIISEPKRPKINRIIDLLRREDIEAIDLYNFIRDITNYIDEWRNELKVKGLVKQDTKPALPETLYILRLLEYLKDSKALRFKSINPKQ